jgi:hypothetical protein
MVMVMGRFVMWTMQSTHEKVNVRRLDVELPEAGRIEISPRVIRRKI